ncbi:unnamed protein product [Prorocentrum cordatum]|uniref:CSD domain-containing protein n=1 Tax=Prorocentrum cordatum TaxID=2364126 RepID=A0ABN9X2Q9_9DINO|nr:unnamed protein product [Polarella glacialis]
MPTGKIKNFFQDKGFGFITPDDGGEDVFVHRKVHGDGQDRTAYLEAGDAVQYEVEWDDRRGKATPGHAGRRARGDEGPPATTAARLSRRARLRSESGPGPRSPQRSWPWRREASGRPGKGARALGGRASELLRQPPAAAGRPRTPEAPRSAQGRSSRAAGQEQVQRLVVHRPLEDGRRRWRAAMKL